MSTKKRRKRTKPGEIPQILHFKSRDLAYVLIQGQKKYLGYYDGITISPEVEAERMRVWSEYLANREIDPSIEAAKYVTVAVLVDHFFQWARENYVKNGRSTGSDKRILTASRELLRLYAATPAIEFTPLRLKTVRNAMLESGVLCRKTINMRIGLIRQIFQLGVENEMIPETTWRALKAVRHLRRGRSSVRETRKVRPVSDVAVEETLRYCSTVIQDMVKIQRHTGMRPGEMLAMRAEDIYREGDEFPDGYEFPPLRGCWVYIPEEHKTEHHGRIRFVMLGETCRQILTPYMMDVENSPGEYFFSPEQAAILASLDRRRKRKTKVQPSQVYRRKENPKRKPGKKYNTNSYRTAVQRAVERRNEAERQAAEREGRKPKLLKKWFPNQLRHAKATELREKYGIQVAQVVLGHAKLSTTEIYAEAAKKDIIDIAVEWG